VACPTTGGSSLLQRLSAFFSGLGIASGVGFYFLYQDLHRSGSIACTFFV
jgi:hypothetical protein